MWAILYIILAAAVVVITALGIFASRKERAKHNAVQADYDKRMLRYEAAQQERNYGRTAEPVRPDVLDKVPPKGWQVALVGAGALALLSLIFSICFIGSKTIGIEKQFNVYVSTLDSGVHFVRPWAEVERFPLTIQPMDINACGDCETDGDTKPAVPVSFAGAGRGWGEFTPRWAIMDDTTSGGAKALWEKYRDFDNVRDNLVYPIARDTFRNVASTYAPVDAVAKQQEISDKATEAMNAKLARYGVYVDSLSLTGLVLDAKTQESLDRINISAANVVNAENERLRAVKDAETAAIREKSGILSTQGNLRYCLDVTNAWKIENNGPLPAGWNCFGNAATPVLPLQNTK